jgi:hypothetical protein
VIELTANGTKRRPLAHTESRRIRRFGSGPYAKALKGFSEAAALRYAVAMDPQHETPLLGYQEPSQRDPVGARRSPDRPSFSSASRSRRSRYM